MKTNGVIFDYYGSLDETANNRNWQVLIFHDDKYSLTYYRWNYNDAAPYIEIDGAHDETYWTQERKDELAAALEPMATEDIVEYVKCEMTQYDLWLEYKPEREFWAAHNECE